MSDTTDGPMDPPKRKLIVRCLADIAPTDYKKLAEIIPGAIRFLVVYYDEVRDIYDLPLDRCRNYGEILGWAHHLCAKKWMKPGLLKHFIHLACEANGIEFPWI